MTPLAQVGGVSAPIQLDAQGLLNNLATQVCSTIQASMRENYQFQNYMAVNLTARMVQGELKADSFMDGITDDARSSATSTARNNPKHVLNSLWLSRPDLQNSSFTCTPTTFYGLGLNDCDVKFMKLMTSSPVTAIDSNQNSILDFIEILKGSNPLLANSNVTLGADHLPLIYAIGNGYDVDSDNSVHVPNPNDLMRAQFTYVSGGSHCARGEDTMNAQLTNIPLVHTQAYNDGQTGPLSLSHAQDENVIAIIYTATPAGALNGASSQTFVALFRVPYGNVQQKHIQPGEFILLQGAPQ